MIVEYHLDQGLDQQGWPEEFTSDVFLVLREDAAAHLDWYGLPKIGCDVHPGMVLICKIGATKSYCREALTYDLDFGGMEDREILINKHKHMLYDASFYVPEGVNGRVVNACFKPHGQFQRAVVRVELKKPSSKQSENSNF